MDDHAQRSGSLDDKQVDVRAGDCTSVFPGGRHALKNTGDTDLRFIVICIKPAHHRNEQQ